MCEAPPDAAGCADSPKPGFRLNFQTCKRASVIRNHVQLCSKRLSRLTLVVCTITDLTRAIIFQGNVRLTYERKVFLFFTVV